MVRRFVIKKKGHDVPVANAEIIDQNNVKIMTFRKFNDLPVHQNNPNITQRFYDDNIREYPLSMTDETIVWDGIQIAFGNEAGFNMGDYKSDPFIG